MNSDGTGPISGAPDSCDKAAGKPLADKADSQIQSRYRLVLASSSPRRLDLLKSLGLSFEVIPSNVEEDLEGVVTPEKLVVDLAISKAQAVAQLLSSGKGHVTATVESKGKIIKDAMGDTSTLVLGADTIVVLDNEILGKPSSPEDACVILSRLSGRCHRVYTGVAIVRLSDKRVESDYQTSDVFFRKIEPAEIESYVFTGEPMDKAGAYALQGTGSMFVEKIEGCFTNIIGLSIPLVVQMLRRFGVSILGAP